MQDNTKSGNDNIFKLIRQNWIFILIWLLSGFFLFCGILKVYFDDDIYHMLSAGKAIAQYGILREDIFFLDEGHKITIQQWLYDLVVYHIYDHFGKIGILIFTLIMTVLFIFFAVKILKFYGVDIRLGLTSVILICILSFDVFSIRPGLLTMVLLLTQMYLCEKHKKTGKLIYLLFIPFLTLLEINFHSALWIAHYVFLLPYIVSIPTKIRKHIKLEDNHISIKKLALPIAGMTASLFINPYLLDGILILINQKEIKSLGIKELVSPALYSKFGIVLILALMITALLYGKTKIHSSNAFMFLGTSILMLLNLRNIQQFSIGLVAILCDLLCFIDFDKVRNTIHRSRKLIKILCTVLTISIIITYAINKPLTSYFKDEPSDNDSTPVLAVEYLNEHATKTSRIFTDFNGGAYISWNGYKIYFCSRTEAYCKNVNGGYDLIDEYKSIYYNYETDPTETYTNFLQKYNFDYLVVSTGNRMYTYLVTNDQYETVVYGNGYAVFKTTK